MKNVLYRIKQGNGRGIRAAAALLLAAVLLYGIWLCAKPCADLREDVFRLHILANSDSLSDQNLKLAVRDALLPQAKELFAQTDIRSFPGETPAMQMAAAARSLLPALSEAAQQAVYAQGSTQTAAVMVAREEFPVKRYENLTMPAGSYWCLRIVLGSGQGHNWWCVLYPPLCISPAAAEDCFSDSELMLLQSPQKYRFRLALLDWLQKLKRK